jgi:hypothetical protein
VRALSTSGKTATVTQSTVGLDVDEALDVHADVLAEIAFDITLVLDDLTDTVNLVFAEILDLLEWVNIRGSQDTQRTWVTDPVNVSEPDPSLLLAGQIDASYTCHANVLLGCPRKLRRRERLCRIRIPAVIESGFIASLSTAN